MNLEELKQIIQQLKAENNPNNNDLIKFYEAKLEETYSKAIEEAIKIVAKGSASNS